MTIYPPEESMITWPHCGSKNSAERALCKNCNQLLERPPHLTAMLNNSSLVDKTTTETHFGVSMPPHLAQELSPKKVRLVFVEDPQQVIEFVIMLERVIIGRTDVDRNVYPDIDLTPYQAFEHGISRTHAFFYQDGDNVYLQDLASANGTAINRQRLHPQQSYTLQDQDELMFGTLELIVRLR